MNKTNVMISGEQQKVTPKAVRRTCNVCGRGVGNNSIQCTSCQKWVHRKCSGINGSKYKVMITFIWHGYLSGVWCRFAYGQLMPLPLTISCCSKSRWFYFSGASLPRAPGQGLESHKMVLATAAAAAVVLFLISSDDADTYDQWKLTPLGHCRLVVVYRSVVCHRVCNPAYLVPVLSRHKLGGLRQEGHLT